MNEDLAPYRSKLLGSLLSFTKAFYKIRTGRDFEVSEPIGRESHHITICRELTSVFKGDVLRLNINVPPGHGKSTILIHFIAWAMAHYPDSQFLYVSHTHDLASAHTHTIRQIMQIPLYEQLFDISLRKDSSAKDRFITSQGGAVRAYGSAGAITGMDAGLPNLDRFSGGIIIDDAHKPDEVHSDTMRGGVIRNYNETLKPRVRSPNVPIIFLGQRLHEDDLPNFLIQGNDGYKWKSVILKAIDETGNVLHPKVNPLEMLLKEQEFNPYVFSAQYQQDPSPASGGIFKTDNFVLHEEDPNNISATFITVDTAETEKQYNDATAFSFWGLYRVKHPKFDAMSSFNPNTAEIETDIYALHWLDCLEIRIEPKDLMPYFMQFYADCMRYRIKPNLVAVEKKSTGVTMHSILSSIQGLQIIDVPRNSATGSKTDCFLATQPFVASKRISLPRYGKHTQICIDHCKKITANNTHRHDDIADTLYQAVKIALIDEFVPRGTTKGQDQSDAIIDAILSNHKNLQKLRSSQYGRPR